MPVTAKSIFCAGVLALLGACAAEQGEQTLRPPAETLTGSNIPRHSGSVRSDTNILTDDAVTDLIKSNGPRGRPGG